MKYTKEVLEEAAKDSISVSEVVRKLRGKNCSGSFNTHIKSRLMHFGIDISHFLGQSYLKGTESNKKRSSEDILKYGRTEPTFRLRRALLESGVPHKCSECGITDTWNDRPIVLQIDHIVADRKDNRKSNLRFLCPNCHSQTGNYAGKSANKRILGSRLAAGPEALTFKTGVRISAP